MSTDTPSQGIGLPEAATAFESFLSGKPEKQEPEDNAADETSADDAEALEAAPSDDETPPLEEGAEDEEAAATDEEAEDAPDPMDQLVTVKIDGKEEQIPLKEAIAGYQRTADYTRKTMALSERGKQLDQEYHQVMAERQQYAQLLPVLQQQLQEMAQQEPDWQRLYAEDPLEYVRQKDLARERQDQLQAVTAEQQRVVAQMQQYQAQQLQQVVKQGREKLADAIPAWKDAQRFEQDRVNLRRYAQDKLGYSEEEISQVYDHRAVIALRKAMLYDQLVAKKPAPVPQNGPRPLRAGAPQTVPTRRTSEITKGKQRLAQTGRISDAAKLFETLL